MTHNKYWKKAYDRGNVYLARLCIVPSIKYVKCAMRINSPAILRKKIAWSRASKRLVPNGRIQNGGNNSFRG